jgi:ferredoxin
MNFGWKSAVRYRIGEKCIQCFACIRNRVCPEAAILERNGPYLIDTSKCTECGACYAGQEFFCPVRAFIDDQAVVSPKPGAKRSGKPKPTGRRRRQKTTHS